MKLGISRQHVSLLIEYARDAVPDECCGLLFGDNGEVSGILLTDNVAEDRASRFEIDPAQLVSAQKAAREGGPGLLGYFHSHPNGKTEPSATDAGLAAPDGHIWIIIARGQITAWQATSIGSFHGRFNHVEIDITG